MAESRHEQIAVALRDHLAGIIADGGANFWYTPAAVGRCLAWDDSFLDASLDYMLFLKPGLETHREEATKQVRAEAEMLVLIARKVAPVTERPFVEEEPSRWTIVDRCVRDVLKKLWDWTSNEDLATLIINIATEGVVVNRDDTAAGWALGELRFVVDYQYQKVYP